MNGPSRAETTAVERVHRAIGRAGYGAAVAGLSIGVALFLLHQLAVSAWLLMATCGLLAALPVVNVVAVLAEEVRRRDWYFVALAGAVLALIGYAVLARLSQT